MMNVTVCNWQWQWIYILNSAAGANWSEHSMCDHDIDVTHGKIKIVTVCYQVTFFLCSSFPDKVLLNFFFSFYEYLSIDHPKICTHSCDLGLFYYTRCGRNSYALHRPHKTARSFYMPTFLWSIYKYRIVLILSNQSPHGSSHINR